MKPKPNGKRGSTLQTLCGSHYYSFSSFVFWPSIHNFVETMANRPPCSPNLTTASLTRRSSYCSYLWKVIPHAGVPAGPDSHGNAVPESSGPLAYALQSPYIRQEEGTVSYRLCTTTEGMLASLSLFTFPNILVHHNGGIASFGMRSKSVLRLIKQLTLFRYIQ